MIRVFFSSSSIHLLLLEFEMLFLRQKENQSAARNAGRAPSVCLPFPLPLDPPSSAAGLQSVSALFFSFFAPEGASNVMRQIRGREGAAAAHVSNVCFCYFSFQAEAKFVSLFRKTCSEICHRRCSG